MTFKQACEKLMLNKGTIMQYAFGKNYAGIDSAIDMHGPDYKTTHDFLFWNCTDCTRFPYKIIDLRYAVPKHIRALIVCKASLYDEIQDDVIKYQLYAGILREIEEALELRYNTIL